MNGSENSKNNNINGRKEESESKNDENRNNNSFMENKEEDIFNDIKENEIINILENQHTWTFFKITITQEKENTDIYLKIEDILDEKYITNNENNNTNGRLLNKEEAKNLTKGEIYIANIIENENIINKNNNNGNNNTYYVLVKDITHKKDLVASLFSSLDKTAEDQNFTYSISIVSANTTGVNDMSYMFYKCKALTAIKGLEKWKTEEVTTMSSMFSGCEKLAEIKLSDNWNTNKVTNMSYMFSECKKLEEIKLSDNWNTSNVENMSNMFRGCEKLKTIKGLEKWKPNKVKNMNSMFEGCKSLNLSNEITLKVAKGCNREDMHTGCTEDFQNKIKVEDTE